MLIPIQNRESELLSKGQHGEQTEIHPKVVEAGQIQISRLNANTRYVYDQLQAYAATLLSKFPHPLNKEYFVNSGSAASDLALRLAFACAELLKKYYHNP